MARGMSESSLREGILQYCRGKFLSTVVLAKMSSLQNRWCCATGAKLTICLVRIALWLRPPQRDLICLVQNRMRLLRISFLLAHSRNPQIVRRGVTGVLQRKNLAVTLARSRLQAQGMMSASVPETPLQKPVASTPQKKPVKRTNHLDSSTQRGPTNQRTVRRLRTLRAVDQKFAMYQNIIGLFQRVLFGLKSRDIDYEAKLLSWAGELIYQKLREKIFFQTLAMYTRRFTLDKELNPGPMPAVFDDMLYDLVDKVWSLLSSEEWYY